MGSHVECMLESCTEVAGMWRPRVSGRLRAARPLTRVMTPKMRHAGPRPWKTTWNTGEEHYHQSGLWTVHKQQQNRNMVKFTSCVPRRTSDVLGSLLEQWKGASLGAMVVNRLLVHRQVLEPVWVAWVAFSTTRLPVHPRLAIWIGDPVLVGLEPKTPSWRANAMSPRP